MAAVTGLFVVGQWGLPITRWIGGGGGLTMLVATTFLRGACQVVAIGITAYVAATSDAASGREPARAVVADDRPATQVRNSSATVESTSYSRGV